MPELLTRIHPRAPHLILSGMVALSCVGEAGRAFGNSYWGQAQGHLESFDGKPLIAANWSGRYRPYVFEDGRYVALLESEKDEYATLDLMTPIAVSPTAILLSGSEAGKPEFDVFVYDTRSRTLRNLTGTPAVDEGRICGNLEARLVAFRSRPLPSANAGQGQRSSAGAKMGSKELGENALRDGQRVARLTDALEQIGANPLPPFDDCVWLDAKTLLGAERRGPKYLLHHCTVGHNDVRCESRSALADVEALTGFLDPEGQAAGVIARRRGDAFRAPFVLRAPFDTLALVPLPEGVRGDVLDRRGDVLRVGREGRYTSTLAPHSRATVYVTRAFGDRTFAIAASERMPRTLARLDGADWELLPHPSVVVPEDPALPTEVWIGAQAAKRYQAFLFGELEGGRVVVWWHGGPQESVSPRFNPYFQRLHELGFAVLAVNYPGSTGRGAQYEKSFTTGALGECVTAVWSYLRANGVRTVVSWSVSSGSTVQRAVLAQRVPVSAVVDQSGWGRSTLLEDTHARHIPFFTIRGRNDPYGPIAHVDYSYAGGHDVTVEDDFEKLFAAIKPFLGAARQIEWPAPAAASAPSDAQTRETR